MSCNILSGMNERIISILYSPNEIISNAVCDSGAFAVAFRLFAATCDCHCVAEYLQLVVESESFKNVFRSQIVVLLLAVYYSCINSMAHSNVCSEGIRQRIMIGKLLEI